MMDVGSVTSSTHGPGRAGSEGCLERGNLEMPPFRLVSKSISYEPFPQRMGVFGLTPVVPSTDCSVDSIHRGLETHEKVVPCALDTYSPPSLPWRR